jgi:hypothetical protein
VIETRALIIKLYLTCEMDYVNGLKIYEAIVEQKIIETAQNQIKKLEQMSDELIIEQKLPEPAEVEEIKEKAQEKISEKKEEVEKKVEDIKKAEEVVSKDPTEVLKETKKEEVKDGSVEIKKEEEIKSNDSVVKEEIKVDVDVPPPVGNKI